MKTRRSFVPVWAAALAASALIASSARGQSLTGHISSLNPDAKTFVVTDTAGGKDAVVTVNDRTILRSKSGKTLTFDDLKQGDGVGVSHVGGVASEVVVAPRSQELIGHVKSVAADLKTMVVKETATGKDYTVVVDGNTRLISSTGKKLTVKDLKQGDGVGIAHTGGLASRISVDVRP